MDVDKEKCNGLRFEPCGTPVFWNTFEDEKPSNLTFMTHPITKSENRLQNFVGRSS